MKQLILGVEVQVIPGSKVQQALQLHAVIFPGSAQKAFGPKAGVLSLGN